MREKVTIGIDVGSSEVIVIIGQRSEDEIHPNIIGVGIQENNGLRKGVVTDVEETVTAITAALDKAERMAGVPVEGAYVSINGEHIQAANNRGLISVAAKQEISGDDVLRVVESAQTVALPANREIIHVIPRTFIVDGQDGIRDPIGMSGTRLEVDAHVITGSTPFIRNLQKTVEQAGVSISNFVFCPIAASKSVLTKKQKELGVVVVDIGAGTTSLVVFDEGDICHSAVLPIGAGHLTSDIAIGLRTSLDVAEKVKIEYGMASALVLSDKDTVDLSRFDKSEDQVISRKYIAEIIEARLMEIFMMVKTELRKIGKDGMLPAGAVLVGGGAKLPGIVDFAKEHLSLPAQIGFPIELRGVVDQLDDPRFANAVGLVLWGMDDQHNLQSYTREPSFGGVFARLKNWFK